MSSLFGHHLLHNATRRKTTGDTGRFGTTTTCRQTKNTQIDDDESGALAGLFLSSSSSQRRRAGPKTQYEKYSCKSNFVDGTTTVRSSSVDIITAACNQTRSCQRFQQRLKTVDITSNTDLLYLLSQQQQNKILLKNEQLDTTNSSRRSHALDNNSSVTDVRTTNTATILTPTQSLRHLRRRSTKMMTNAIQDQATNVKNYVRSMIQPAVDNKLALKLFGSAGAILREQERHTANARWIVHPASNFRFYWDLIMLTFLLVNMIVLPVTIAFFFNEVLSVGFLTFNCVSDTIFILDIMVNFRTGIMHDESGAQVILDPKIIRRRYLRSWFFIDLLSSIPFDYIILFISLISSQAGSTNGGSAWQQQFAQAGRAFRLLRLAKVLSLMKLLRISRLLRYLSQFEAVYFLNLAGVFMRIFNFLGLMLLIGHWSGCIQFLVPVLQGLPDNSWVVINELQNSHWFEQYTWSLWQALSHQLSIGYGRFPPQSTSDVWLTTMSMITGASCYALFIGHASNLIQSLDSSRRNYRDKRKQVDEYMIYRKLPLPLRRRIADYYDNRFRGKLFDEAAILEELSDPLKEAIINYNCRELVKSVPFFTHADPNFVTAVITKLKYEFFQPGDVIVKENTIGDKMYFIQEGVVEIFTSYKPPPVSPLTTKFANTETKIEIDAEVVGKDTVITCLSDGSYFGEICLLTKAKRVASVRAQIYCSLFSLQSESFNLVLEQYPIMRHTLESVAAERLNKIGQNSGSKKDSSANASSPSSLSRTHSSPEDLQKVNELLERVASFSHLLDTSELFTARRRTTTFSVSPNKSHKDATKKTEDVFMTPNKSTHKTTPAVERSFNEHFLYVPSGHHHQRRASSSSTPINKVRHDAVINGAAGSNNNGNCVKCADVKKLSFTSCNAVENVEQPVVFTSSLSSTSSSSSVTPPYCSPASSPSSVVVVDNNKRHYSVNNIHATSSPVSTAPFSWMRRQTIALTKNLERPNKQCSDNNNNHKKLDNVLVESCGESEQFLSTCTNV